MTRISRGKFKHMIVGGMLPALTLVLMSCAPPPSYEEIQLLDAPEPRVSTEIYFYPKLGQSPQQQDRDRYECYLWAVEQSGFDPSEPPLAPHQRIVVRPAQPEGQNTVLGALSGAIIGAAIGSPHDTGKGAVIGSMAGALIGAASDSAQQQEAEAMTRRYDRLSAQKSAAIERKAQDYRRAMKACLDGRGYSVR